MATWKTSVLNGISLHVLQIQNRHGRRVYFTYFIEHIPCETHENNQVLNSRIFNEIVDISCTSCHENSLHDSFEE